MKPKFTEFISVLRMVQRWTVGVWVMLTSSIDPTHNASGVMVSAALDIAFRGVENVVVPAAYAIAPLDVPPNETSNVPAVVVVIEADTL